MRRILAVIPCLAVFAASCTPQGVDSAPTDEASRIRAKTFTRPEVLAAFDRALELRASTDVESRARWGDVVDAALASGALDEASRRRAAWSSVMVEWYGQSEGSDENNKLMPGFVGVMFSPLTGPRTTLEFDASLTSATVGNLKAEIGKPDEVAMAGMEVGTLPGTFLLVTLPEGSKGRTLTVKWKVRIFDRATKKPACADWEWTEFIEIPQFAQRRIEGRRVRPSGG